MRSHSRLSGLFLPAALGAALAAAAAGCGSTRAPTGPASPTPSTGTTAASPPAASPRPAVWRLLPRAPVAAPPQSVVSVWTGSQFLIHGITWSGETNKVITLGYTPATRTWRTLAPGPLPVTVEGHDTALWTGHEMLVAGLTSAAYNPATNTWRPIARDINGTLGSVGVWTGHQAIFWGGGCCGGARASGAAYTPATDSWRALPPSPLSERYAPGVWTGKELIIAGGFGPDAGHTGRMLTYADAAAYNPATRTWRTLPLMPEARAQGNMIWDGAEALYIAGTRADARAPSADGVAYSPSANRWRRLPAMEVNRSRFAAVWTGHEVLVWGGLTGPFPSDKVPPHGVAYDPATNRWSALPMAPLRGRGDPTAVWTGSQMIVWGGGIWGELKTTYMTDGAAFRPAA